MAKRIGKYKVTKKESEVSLRDGGAIDGVLTRRTPETIIDWNYIECPTPTVSFLSINKDPISRVKVMIA